MEVTESDRQPGDRSQGAITLDETGTERVWRAGKLPPMPIRKLPEAPQAAHILGPAMNLVAGRLDRRLMLMRSPRDHHRSLSASLV